MALTAQFYNVGDVEAYVTERLSARFFEGVPVTFAANEQEEFGLIGSRCILDRASMLNIDPQSLVPEILQTLGDARFSSERGFLNFSDTSARWLLTPEECRTYPKQSVYIIKENQTRLSLLRLSLMASLQNILSGQSFDAIHPKMFDSLMISAEQADEIIAAQTSEEAITFWCAPKGLPTKLYEKLIHAPARLQGRLSFQVLKKPFIVTQIVDWPDTYLDTITKDVQTFYSAAYYYSLPLQASDLDPQTCFLEENANIFSFGKRVLKRISNLMNEHSIELTAADVAKGQDIEEAYTKPLAPLLKILPLRKEAAISRGELFAFTEGVQRILTLTERTMNNPDFRGRMGTQKLSSADQFIVKNLMNQLSLLFKGH